jgi:hypothetical protein
MIAYLPAASIVMTVVGTLMIFLFGMPLRKKPAPTTMVLGWTEKEPTRGAVLWSGALDFFSWLGLALVLIGGGIQTYYALP